SLQAESFKTSIEILYKASPGRYTGALKGPARKRRNEIDHSMTRIALEILDEKKASLTIGKVKLDLLVGQWSPIIEVNFKVNHFYSFWAITRVILTQGRPEPRLYFLPLQ